MLGIWSATPGGGLGFSQALVFQSGDTLKFYKNDSIVDQWLLESKEESEAHGTKVPTPFYFSQKARVAQDNKSFLLYEEKKFIKKDSTITKISLYKADKKKVWTRTKSGTEKFSFDLTKIYPDRVILFITDTYNSSPRMEILKETESKKTLNLREWSGIVNYEVSPNGRYIIFHAKKPYNNKLWDYIYFTDLNTNRSWEYLFPFCFSCKRGWLELKIDDEGKSEVIYKNKNEHRIFDKEGNLVDVFVKLD